MLGVYHLLHPNRPGYRRQFPPAHAEAPHVHVLHGDAPLLEPALGLFGVKALGRAKNLNIHAVISLGPQLGKAAVPAFSMGTPSFLIFAYLQEKYTIFCT